MARSLKRKGGRTETESIYWYVSRLLYHVPSRPSPLVPDLITQRFPHTLNPAKHLLFNLNRCHSRRVRRQGPHTGQIRSPLIIPNERRTKDRLSLGRGLPSFRFPAVPVPSLLLQDSFRGLTRRSLDVCLTSFPFVLIEERCSKTRVVWWLRVEE
jgi:hypothetical protein